jgi:hypothetical protein
LAYELLHALQGEVFLDGLVARHKSPRFVVMVGVRVAEDDMVHVAGMRAREVCGIKKFKADLFAI